MDILALSKLLGCDVCKSFARAPIRNCGQFHKVCSVCSGEAGADKTCPAEGCTGSLMPKTLKSNAATFVSVAGHGGVCEAPELGRGGHYAATRLRNLLLDSAPGFALNLIVRIPIQKSRCSQSHI